jgi:hypothetical protein
MVATTTEQVSLPGAPETKALLTVQSYRRFLQPLLVSALKRPPHAGRQPKCDISVVHPLVLLSVADHHARSVARASSKRVVGVLLGQDNGKSINVANSFGVPFEEDDKDAKSWFLDHNYVESMFDMFKKVNGAWYRSSFRVPDGPVVVATTQRGNA